MNKLLLRSVFGFLSILILTAGCDKPSPADAVHTETEKNVRYADTILTHGKIYTQIKQQPWVEAIAIADGKIAAIGSTEEISSMRNEQTREINLDGKFVMPGLFDAHVHPAWGGVKALFQCNFPFSATPDEVAARVSQCVEEQPESEWITGGQWTSDFFRDNDIGSPRLFLDKVSADKAVLLRDDSGHNMWLNSKALQLAGISSESENPPGGSFEREADGKQPNGLLVEAFTAVNKVLPALSQERYEAGAQYAVNQANSFGITGFKDASASEPEVIAFYNLEQKKKLTAHVATCLYESVGDNKNALNIDKFVMLREKYKTEHVLTNFVKIFLDGVPTASRTAAMLAPYVPAKEGDEDNYGSLHLSPEVLTAVVTRLDSLGFTVKIHTAGDRAIRVALDAIESARATNGDSGLAHELAHAEFIDPADIPRFRELNVIADFSPYIWFPSPIVESVINAVGERGKYSFAARDLLDNNARILTGSDWPSAVPDMNPWTGIEAMVSRENPFGDYPGTIWPEQAITLEETLEIYTMGGREGFKT